MKRIVGLMPLVLLLAALTGCSGLSYQELYTLPRATEDYYDLQEALNDVLSEGLGYAAPSAGARQEPVQLMDLDGDGQDEAIAFFRVSDYGQVKIYIFSKSDGVYAPAAVIDGAGTAVSSVEYVDLDGKGNLELVVTYQVSESVTQAVQVTGYQDGAVSTLLSVGCARYELADLDQDGLEELLCLGGSGTDGPASVECYDGQEGVLHQVGTVQLSFPYESLENVQKGALSRQVQGIVFSGVSTEGSLLMEALTIRDQVLEAIPWERWDEDTLQSGPVYPEDRDGDGLLELPQVRSLPAYDRDTTAEPVVDWYRLEGEKDWVRAYSTYQDGTGRWYLMLPEAWNGALTLRRETISQDVSTVTFFHRKAGGTPQEILTIYTLRGSRQQEYAQENSLTILYNDSETMYAVTLAAAETWEGTVNISQVSEMFRLVGGDSAQAGGAAQSA